VGQIIRGLSTTTDPIGIAIVDPTLLPTGTSTTPTAPLVMDPTLTTVAPPPPFQFYTYDPTYYAWLMTPL
jgi:hypothetical protein